MAITFWNLWRLCTPVEMKLVDTSPVFQCSSKTMLKSILYFCVEEYWQPISKMTETVNTEKQGKEIETLWFVI